MTVGTPPEPRVRTTVVLVPVLRVREMADVGGIINTPLAVDGAVAWTPVVEDMVRIVVG